MSAVHVPAIQAPPPTACKIVGVPETCKDVIRRHGIPGAFAESHRREHGIPVNPQLYA
jgi:hypothetical protein